MEFTTDEHFIYLAGTPYGMKEEIQKKLNGVFVKKGFRFPKNVYAARELLKFFPELRKDAWFIELGKELAAEVDAVSMIKMSNVEIEGLRPYQAQDVKFLAENGSSLVLNEPRTGKTPTMIKTINALGTKRNIVVCPSSLVYNWAKEFEIWYPEMKVYPISGTPKQRGKLFDEFNTIVTDKIKRVMIISKDTWKMVYDKRFDEAKFDMAIVDEAHYLRNYKSAQSKAIFAINATFKYALTGTPAVKHGVDIFGLLHFVNPKQFPSYWQFADRYWVINDDRWGKSIGEHRHDREKELISIMNGLSVQRKRKDVMQWLPAVNKETIYVKMDSKQQKMYDQMLETYTATYDDIEVDTMNKLTQLIRLRQICLDPRLLELKVVGAKTKALIEFAENNDEPFIVMSTLSSYFPLIQPELEKLGKKVGIIDGSISQKQKFQTAERFQNGHYDILLCNIIAAGTGFTLDRSDTVVFLDKDFNPANNEQAQDRIVPTTETKNHNINVISFVVADSVDVRINDILENKEDLTKIINKRELFV